MAAANTIEMERDRDEMNRLFWNEGGVYSVDSRNQHRIAVAVEPVPPLHGISIDGEDLLAARKRRREEQQRRLRQMEIGDEARHQLETMTRADEQVGLTFSGPHDPIVQTE